MNVGLDERNSSPLIVTFRTGSLDDAPRSSMKFAIEGTTTTDCSRSRATVLPLALLLFGMYNNCWFTAS
jgi:hypothetical protein